MCTAGFGKLMVLSAALAEVVGEEKVSGNLPDQVVGVKY